MPRLKMTLAYVGTQYHGWQVQACKGKEQPPTVQAEVIKAVSHITGRHTHVQGAGRTDSGVHADAQVAHFDVDEAKLSINWQLALNTLLPRDIRVKDVCRVPDTFDACFSVQRKAYTYSLWLDRQFVPPRLYPFVWVCGKLDMGRMDAAIPHLIGTHDFASLQNVGTPLKSTVRTIFSITRTPQGVLPEGCEQVDFRFESNGFLKQMVRNIMGLLVACGRGKFNPDDIPELLLACDRQRAPFTAPPQGLTMSQVWYGEK